MNFIEYIGRDDNKFLKWLKLTFFTIGSLIAIPMLVIAFLAMFIEFIAHKYITWLVDVTDTDINFR